MFARIARSYQGSTAVVIGAGGIGGELIKILANNVATLVVADRDEALLDTLSTTHSPAKLLVKRLDVRDASAVAEFFTFVAAHASQPDFLFYAAGLLNVEPLLETSCEAWDRAVSVNLNGVFYCTKAAAQQMCERGRGSICILGSISGTKARSGSRVNPVYNTTKAGIVAFVNAAAIQLRGHGVRINCVSPGPTDTSMMQVQPLQVHSAIQQIALDGRMNSPTEVAELALFVAAHGRFTGEDICLGGGAGLGG